MKSEVLGKLDEVGPDVDGDGCGRRPEGGRALLLVAQGAEHC
ncbi:hypothetical protein [Streptomyces canus]|nr:hypothetical protein [Streptomyces canus]